MPTFVKMVNVNPNALLLGYPKKYTILPTNWRMLTNGMNHKMVLLSAKLTRINCAKTEMIADSMLLVKMFL